MGFSKSKDIKITILNIAWQEISAKEYITFIKGDATDLGMLSDKSFDVVFSNSVIEHIPGTKNRIKMAEEIMRVGKSYFVQTPNFYFPFEPHFLFPCFQYFPLKIKLFLLKRFNMGWFTKCKDDNEAMELLKYNQLLKLSELKQCFPGCGIISVK
jgi:2-polyprenyl-3-methyl-5-hydroxy-6-metoxy-1,4-benzoquinol methylase